MIKFISDIVVELLSYNGSDRQIAEAAWVSTGSFGQDEAVPGLINYLMKHRHGSPFEHGQMIFRIHAPIFVWREWHRHRVGFSYNEESARYKKLDPVFYVPENHRPMMKVDNWKAGRPKFVVGTPDDVTTMVNNLAHAYAVAYETYEINLEMGIDPGLARACLPVGIYSSCIVTCNPRSLMHFLSLRTHSELASNISYPLYEIEVPARKCEQIFAQLFPHTHTAFMANGRVAP
jgi:thymidylate synthase (FAD)